MGADSPRPTEFALLRISGPAEVILGRLIARRGGLWEHNPRAVAVAARGLAAVDDVVGRRTPDIRCDRGERMRGIQIDGSTGFQSEDLVAMGLENELGREALVAWCRVVLSEVGHEVVPSTVTAEDLLEATAAVAEAAGAAVADTNRASSDLTINETEAILIAKRARRLEDAAVTLRVSAQRAARQSKAKTEQR